MKSFRTELESQVVEKDILELEQKIHQFQNNEIDEEKFRTLRLARGIYGQRQEGVQMIRIKIPFGRLNSRQLLRICDVADEYSTGKLHITTRQDIQIHYVSLDRTPELWSELERDEITIREACGNTVRNITASSLSGIDPSEVFDVRPYANAVFNSFLRNPICQEMGRKVKISFSNTENDTALAFMHDLGFIAKIENGQHGFKVMLAGGLGSQSRSADLLTEFLPADKIIPLTEAVLRLFERNGERSNRMKARLKFLVKDIGIDTFKAMIEEELLALEHQIVPIEFNETIPQSLEVQELISVAVEDNETYSNWKNTNVFAQKQDGLFAVGIKVRLGDFNTNQARIIAKSAVEFAGDELTFTIDQNLIIRHVREEQLPRFFYLLHSLDLVDAGFGSAVDITACPGTDTCNLGIANSTSLANKLEKTIALEYPQFVRNDKILIKISGCMNSCGQHMIANIGFQGMSIRAEDKRVLPAVQVLLGGGKLGDGSGRFADKVIKIPSKRAIAALRLLLNEFVQSEQEEFNVFYDELGEKYFYDLLKPLANVDQLVTDDFIDWGDEQLYTKEIGIGECAGAMIDLVATILKESEEKLELAKTAFERGKFSDSLFFVYSSMLNASKALLVAAGKRTNSQSAIISQFEEEFIRTNEISFGADYSETISAFKKNKPSKALAEKQLKLAETFYSIILNHRKKQLKDVN